MKNIKTIESFLYSNTTLESAIRSYIHYITSNKYSSSQDIEHALKLEEYLRYYKDTTFQTFLLEEIFFPLFEFIKNQTGERIQVQGRIKSLERFEEKILLYQQKEKNLNKIHDVLAGRIILPSNNIESCYTILENCITLFEKNGMQILGIKDFIEHPKESGYQSLHLIVVRNDNKLFELQIRTKEMHFQNEIGVLSHSTYKEKKYKKRIRFNPAKIKIKDFKYDKKNKIFVDKAGVIKEINFLNLY